MSKVPSEVSVLTRTSVRSSKVGGAGGSVADKKEEGGSVANQSQTGSAKPSSVGNSKAASEAMTGVSMTTTVLEKKLTTLTDQLESERQARIKAQEELKKTCAELEALEQVLKLRDPPTSKKTGYPGRL